METGTLSLEASNVVAGEEAKALISELKATNALFAAIDGTTNTHFVVFDLTTIGRASQHAGATKYVLAESGLDAALPTLISKPLHVTAKYDAHFDARKAPKPIGVFLGSAVIKNADGTSTVRAVASLWKSDFPDEIKEIQANIASLGASYEVAYPMLAASKDGDIVTISQYEFSGGAILTKATAAHPETQLLVADAIAEKVIKEVGEQITRELGGGDKNKKLIKAAHQGGNTMPKYAGIPEELETVVDAYVATACSSATKDLQNEKSAVTTAMEDMKKEKMKCEATIDSLTKAQAEDVDASAKLAEELTAAKNKLVEATTKVEKLEADLAASSKTLGEYAEAAAVIADKAKVDATWTTLKADWGLNDTQRDKRESLLSKLAHAKEPLTPEEFRELVAGGAKAAAAEKAGAKFPLMAGNGEQKEADEKAIAEFMPAAFWKLNANRALYR